MATTATRDDELEPLIAKLRPLFTGLLGTRDAYAKVTVTVQRGRVAMVHVDQSYTLEQLPDSATSARP